VPEVQVSIISKFKYHGTPCNVKKIQTGDLLRLPHENRAFHNLMYLANMTNSPKFHVY